MASQISNVVCGDQYTNAATIGPLPSWDSQGGYFAVANKPVICQLGISSPPAGIHDLQWGTEIPIPIGNGIVYAGTIAIRFRNQTAGQVATVSGVLFEKAEAAITIIAGGNPNAGPSGGGGNLQIDHNGVAVATEPALDFEDTNTPTIQGVVFSVVDNPGVSVQVAATTPTAVQTYDGGLELVHTVAAAGASQTLNLANGNCFDVTLNSATCAFTLSGATAGKSSAMLVLLRQDVTGGRLATWPGSVTWLTGVPPALKTAGNAIDVITLFSFDGGTSWTGFQASTPPSFATQEVDPDESTASNTYTDLATVGPAATVTVGASGVVLVGWNCQMSGNSSVSVAVSGANTIAASDIVSFFSPDAIAAGRTYAFTGLTPGASTFTMKYRATTGTQDFQRRTLWALAL